MHISHWVYHNMGKEPLRWHITNYESLTPLTSVSRLNDYDMMSVKLSVCSDL